MARVVVEQHQFADTGLVGDLDGVANGAMAPVRALYELVGRELGVVDQHVDSIGQGQDSLVDPCRFGDGLLVVADVGDADTVPVDPVAVGCADMGDGSDGDRCRAHGEAPCVHVMEFDLAGQVTEPDREVRRRHELLEAGLERAAVAGSVDVETGIRTVDRGRRREVPGMWSQWRWLTSAVPRNGSWAQCSLKP